MTRKMIRLALSIALFAVGFAALAACQPKETAVVSGTNFTFKACKETKEYLCSLDVFATGLPKEGNFWLGAIVESKTDKNAEPLYPLFTMSINGKAAKKGAVFTLEAGEYNITPAVFLPGTGKEMKFLVKLETPIKASLPKF